MPETGEWHSQPGHIFQGWLVAERRRRARCSHTTQPAPGGPSYRPPGSQRCPHGVPEVPPQAWPGAFPPLCILHLVLPRARLSPRTHSTHPGAPTCARPSGEASQSFPPPLSPQTSLPYSTFKQFSAFQALLWPGVQGRRCEISLNAFLSFLVFLSGGKKTTKHKQTQTRCGLGVANGAGVSRVVLEINKAGLVKRSLVLCGEGKRDEKRISFSKN